MTADRPPDAPQPAPPVAADPGEAPRSGWAFVVWPLGIVLLLLLYPLSLGPAIALHRQGLLPGGQFWETFYSPLKRLDQTPLGGSFRVYVGWWEGR